MRDALGLTLVELIVAVSILSIGVVLVARGFLTASAGLSSARNRITAVQFLESQMAHLQQQAIEEGGLHPTHDSGITDLNQRPATWDLEVIPVEPEVPAEEEAEKPRQPVELAEVRLRLAWQEGRRDQDVTLVTYLDYREPTETD